MKQRILVYSIDEIAVDYKAVAQSINCACQRDHTHYRVAGLCQTHDCVFFSLEELRSRQEVRYVLVPFSGTSNDQVKADIYTRWSSGFSTRGLIRLSESYLGLFESGERKQVSELHELFVEKS